MRFLELADKAEMESQVKPSDWIPIKAPEPRIAISLRRLGQRSAHPAQYRTQRQRPSLLVEAKLDRQRPERRARRLALLHHHRDSKHQRASRRQTRHRVLRETPQSPKRNRALHLPFAQTWERVYSSRTTVRQTPRRHAMLAIVGRRFALASLKGPFSPLELRSAP